MNVGDIVKLVPGGKDWRIMAIRAAPPMQRGPLLLRLKSKTRGQTIYDYPSSLVTKEEQ